MTSRYLVAAVLVLLSLGLAACGGDGAGEEEAADSGITEVPTAAAVQPTPESEAKITGNLFEYEARGYSVSFPTGWTPEANFLPGPDFSVDAFFAPEEIRGIQPNIAVTCEAVPAGMTLQEYFDTKVDVVRQVTGAEPEVRSRTVGGQEAMVSRYERTAADQSIAKTDVVLLTERCGWDIALTAPLPEEANYVQLFDGFLDSFQFLP
jgi:hypothetical protein